MIRKDPHHGVALFEGSLDLPLDLRLPSNWIEFGIWGLMVFDSQPPWFTLIECMHIFFPPSPTLAVAIRPTRCTTRGAEA